MQEPNHTELNESRKEGFKPAIVSCIINDKKILLLHKKEHNLWQLPQASLQNKEELADAVRRNIEEELGKAFITTCDPLFVYLGSDQIEMLPGKTKETEIQTDDGEVIHMKGKKFYFYAVATSTKDLTIDETQFDEYLWCKHKAGLFIASTIHQPGKKRVTTKIINLLKENNIIE